MYVAHSHTCWLVCLSLGCPHVLYHHSVLIGDQAGDYVPPSAYSLVEKVTCPSLGLSFPICTMSKSLPLLRTSLSPHILTQRLWLWKIKELEVK